MEPNAMYNACDRYAAGRCVFLAEKDAILGEAVAGRRSAAAAVAVIGVLASSPLFTNYLLNGADLSFHLMRIEGIAEGLLDKLSCKDAAAVGQ